MKLPFIGIRGGWRCRRMKIYMILMASIIFMPSSDDLDLKEDIPFMVPDALLSMESVERVSAGPDLKEQSIFKQMVAYYLKYLMQYRFLVFRLFLE